MSCKVCQCTVSKKEVTQCYQHMQDTRCPEHQFDTCRRHGRYRVHELVGCTMCDAEQDAMFLNQHAYDFMYDEF